MSFLSVLVMNVILLLVTVILAIADKFLVSYGRCKITVRSGDERKSFEVDGGGSLLTSLSDNGVESSTTLPKVVGVTRMASAIT